MRGPLWPGLRQSPRTLRRNCRARKRPGVARRDGSPSGSSFGQSACVPDDDQGGLQVGPRTSLGCVWVASCGVVGPVSGVAARAVDRETVDTATAAAAQPSAIGGTCRVYVARCRGRRRSVLRDPSGEPQTSSRAAARLHQRRGHRCAVRASRGRSPVQSAAPAPRVGMSVPAFGRVLARDPLGSSSPGHSNVCKWYWSAGTPPGDADRQCGSRAPAAAAAFRPHARGGVFGERGYPAEFTAMSASLWCSTIRCSPDPQRHVPLRRFALVDHRSPARSALRTSMIRTPSSMCGAKARLVSLLNPVSGHRGRHRERHDRFDEITWVDRRPRSRQLSDGGDRFGDERPCTSELDFEVLHPFGSR